MIMVIVSHQARKHHSQHPHYYCRHYRHHCIIKVFYEKKEKKKGGDPIVSGVNVRNIRMSFFIRHNESFLVTSILSTFQDALLSPSIQSSVNRRKH